MFREDVGGGDVGWRFWGYVEEGRSGGACGWFARAGAAEVSEAGDVVGHRRDDFSPAQTARVEAREGRGLAARTRSGVLAALGMTATKAKANARATADSQGESQKEEQRLLLI